MPPKHIENMLLIYASSFVQIPASAIYDKQILKQFEHIYPSCHIYMVGVTPEIVIQSHRPGDGSVFFVYTIAGVVKEIEMPLPPEAKYFAEGEAFFVEFPDGERKYADELAIIREILSRSDDGFEVLYIGQAYGKAGERNAVDRLLRHETLQKISLSEPLFGKVLSLTMLEIQDGNSVMTLISSQSGDSKDAEKRFALGVQKLHNTDDSERVSIYEAALIRYFRPKYNTIFKDSFPSTNNKSLSDCYDKDFYGISAEICFDNMPYRIFSESVKIQAYHMVRYELHDDESRKLFFFAE